MIYLAIVIIVIGLICMIISKNDIKKSKQIKFQRYGQIKQLQENLKQRTNQLNILEQQVNTCKNFISNSKSQLDLLHGEQNKITQEITIRKEELEDYYKTIEKQALTAFNLYADYLDQAYTEVEKNHASKIKEIKAEEEVIENKIEQMKKHYAAIAQAKQRQQDDENEILQHRIIVSDKMANDINKLNEFKSNLYNPTYVSKIIWSIIMKPTSEMCKRVLGTSNPVCGIYRITYIGTGEVYIGQSVNIAERWKQHVKCGLGIEASSTNKLYQAMQNYSPLCFKFELLEKCNKNQLNEKERFYIDLYQSNKIGFNMKAGNK